MKKCCAVLCMLVFIGTFAGCGEEKPTDAAPSVTIQIPREIISVKDDAEIVEAAKDEGMEASVDEDVVTYKMTPEKQQELLLSYKTGFEEQIPKVIDDGTIPGMVDVTYNEDMTEFTLLVDAEIFDSTMDGMGFGIFYTTGMGYQLYAGVPDEQIDVHVIVMDQDNKHQISEFSMREVFAQHQAPGDDSD